MAEPVEMNVSDALDKNFDSSCIRRVEVDLTSIHGNKPTLAYLLENVFSDEECERLISLSEMAGYTTALIHSGDEAVEAPGYRDSDRVMIDDKEFVKILESRIQSHLPQRFENRRFLEINERLRFLRYSPGDQFKPHFDASYARPDYTARTLITLQMYLNEGFDGGETTFLNFDKDVRVAVVPKRGMILVFEHDLYHEGSLVRSGNKYNIQNTKISVASLMTVPKEFGVRCLLCQQTIQCQQDNTSILVDHVKLKHPDIKITNLPKELKFFPKLNEPTNKPENKPTNKDKIAVSNTRSSTGEELNETRNRDQILGSNTDKGNTVKTIMEENNALCDTDGNYIPKYTENARTKSMSKNLSSKTTNRKRLYKTSVETWKPGRDKILCPKCDAIVRPLIRTSADRVSHSTFGAALIMTCWPFCFFPFLFPAPIQKNLHCSICGYYFGTYDYQKQTMNVPKESSQQQKTGNVGTTDGIVEKQGGT